MYPKHTDLQVILIAVSWNVVRQVPRDGPYRLCGTIISIGCTSIQVTLSRLYSENMRRFFAKRYAHQFRSIDHVVQWRIPMK